MPPANKSLFSLITRPSANRQAGRLERRIAVAQPTDPTGLSPTADPYSANVSRKIGLDRNFQLVYGRVVDAVAYTQIYKVQLDRGLGVLPCYMACQTGLSVTGARQLNTLVPGCPVLVAMPPHAAEGIIIGVLPDWMISAKDALSDFIVQGSNVGLHVDAYHNYPFGLPSGGGITDRSSGRPFDSLTGGEWGAVTDSGLLVSLDPNLIQLRVDEETGVFGFLDDSFLRVSGHSLQIAAAGHEDNQKDDQEEFDQDDGYTPYLWEARGAWDTQTQLYTENDASESQVDTPYYSRFEPSEDDQQAIHRMRTFRGYLGQAESKRVFIPPENASGIEQYPNQSKYIGVAEQNISLDGQINMRSARSVIIGKRALIQAPKRLKEAEDPTGDNETNYRANGVYGSGPPHKVGDIPDPTNNGPATGSSLTKTAAFLDYYAHSFNWIGNHPFFYHTLDWYIPDESDSTFADQMKDGIPDFSVLNNQQYVNTPQAINLFVDTRYGQVAYYPNDSFLALTEDGGVILAGGFGEEIRFQNGSIILSAPGDIHIQSGKDMYTLAGRNAVVRANDSVDIAANNTDVRIKADNNVMILGGNNQCGGVLIESKSPQPAFKINDGDETEVIGGIILRAEETAIVLYGQQINLTLSDDGAGGDDETRMIILDAGTSGEIISHADRFYRSVETSFQDVIKTTVNEYYEKTALIGTQLRVAGDTFIDGCLVASGKGGFGDTCSSKHFFENSSEVDDQIEGMVSSLSDRMDELSEWLDELPHDYNRLADNSDVLKIEFFFRSSDKCGATDWVLPETRWQQMARVGNSPVDQWTENAVSSDLSFADSTMPPPGKDTWTGDNGYLQEDLNMFQLDNNYAEDLGPTYETPQYASPTLVALDGNFPVITN